VLAEQAQHCQFLRRATKACERQPGRHAWVPDTLPVQEKAAVRTMTPVLPAPVGADTTCEGHNKRL
jgi:hypothetical protein